MKVFKIVMVCAAALAATSAVSAGDKVTAAPADVPAVASKASPAGIIAGYRGVSIPLGGDQLLFLKKDDMVDVLVTFDAKTKDDDKTERQEKVTATILQNVLVINVRKPEKADGFGAVELLLNPNEAQYAALSIAQGKITISVRAPGDVEMHPMEIASFRRLIK